MLEGDVVLTTLQLRIAVQEHAAFVARIGAAQKK
jgi:hypothetical protein